MKKLFLFFFALVVSIGTAWADKTIYLEPNIWDVNNATEYYAVYAWGGSSDAAWYDMEAVAGTSYYKATIPDDRTGILFTRAGSAEDAKNFDNKWNQTVDITLPNAVNSAAYIITGWDGGDGKSTVKYSAKFPNYALLGTASASSGNAGNAIDGNTGTRWESAQTDAEWWMVDLGAVKTFNTISIMWEGAYSKSFTIGVSADGENFTEVVNVADQSLSGFPYVQNLQFEAKSAQYIKFNVVKRGTQWGNSFWEFGVYNLTNPLSLSTINIKGDKASISIGGTATFTATGKDQLDGIMATGDLTWESSAPAVGTVDAGVLTGASVGTTTVTAKNGTVVSNGVEVEVVAGEKINLFTNWVSRIYTLGADTKAASRDGMVDANDGSLWELHGTTGADATSRTYETGFIADLGAIYDVTKISIHFEGACSENFGLSFAGADGVFGDNVYTGGKTGINNHTEEFSGESVTNARYVKFLSTKASSEWGVKIYDFSVYGIKKSDIEDTEAPTVNATEAAKTEETITLTLTGTDNSSKYLTYEVAANDIPATYFFGPAGANTTAVFSNLNGGTTYNFAIYSIDGKGNRSTVKELSVTTTGETFVLTAAPVPTKAAADVKSIYSNAYIAATAYGYGGWGQSTAVGTETVGEDNILHLTNYNYLGFEYTTQQDLSDMEYLHIDILPMQAMNFGITPIIVNAGSGSGTENSQSVGTLTVKEWNSIDIPLSQFNMDFTQLSHQLKIDKGSGTDVVYVDNIYFWKGSSTEVTVSFKNSIGWESVNAFAWTDGGASYLGDWPGTPMTKSGDVYTITFDPGATIPEKIVFNNGGTGDFNQTADLAFEDGKTYDMGYYVAGNMNSWGVDENYVMSLNTYCTSNVEYKLGRKPLGNSNEFKVVLSRDGSTVHTWYPGGDKPNYTITADGDYNIFFRPNKDGDPDWHEGYIWAGTVGDLEDLGTDPTTGAQVLDGTWNADDFAALDNNLKANSYDLTGVEGITGTLDVINKTANPYCMFITKSPGQVNRNEVVWDATNNRYNGYAMILEETTSDNKTYDINTNIKPIHVTNPIINRFFPGGLVYTTIVLPFDYASIPNPEKEKTKVYAISSSSTTAGGTTVTFTEVNSMEAGKPYLINSFAAVLNFNEVIETVDIDWTTTDEKKGDATAVGTFEALTLSTSDNAYVLPGNIPSTGDLSFQKAGNVSVRPFRAYITVPAASGAKINVMIDDATGIHAATAEQLEGIFNIYSIDGKIVRQDSNSKVGLPQGIYIINGKKVVIK